jgi:hypothetical protein
MGLLAGLIQAHHRFVTSLDKAPALPLTASG